MIKLKDSDKLIIRICKGHHKDIYPFIETVLKTFEKPFMRIYGWDPTVDNNYHDYMNGLFFHMYETYLKIADDVSTTNLQMRNLFFAVFYKSISRESDSPVERGIMELYGLIQGTRYLDEQQNQRFDLNIDEWLEKTNEYGLYERK